MIVFKTAPIAFVVTLVFSSTPLVISEGADTPELLLSSSSLHPVVNTKAAVITERPTNSNLLIFSPFI
jgi:hypothetical protein